jgi:hypothetical protein
VPQSETGKINCVRLPRCGRLPPGDANSQPAKCQSVRALPHEKPRAEGAHCAGARRCVVQEQSRPTPITSSLVLSSRGDALGSPRNALPLARHLPLAADLENESAAICESNEAYFRRILDDRLCRTATALQLQSALPLQTARAGRVSRPGRQPGQS